MYRPVSIHDQSDRQKPTFLPQIVEGDAYGEAWRSRWEDDRIGSYQQHIEMEIGYGNIMKYINISTYPISMT